VGQFAAGVTVTYEQTVTMAKSLPSGLIRRTAAKSFSAAESGCTQLNTDERENGTLVSFIAGAGGCDPAKGDTAVLAEPPA